ncbi:MAG TPA: 3-phosphoshikimate 1-carboxyvinyltransferase [Methanomicrobia archaeon]|nr:3-phosphoshikimate 1-carboxyvinyltransferase [Methanomicrobia archaeon]
MNARVRRSTIEGEAIAPPSKSYTHRAITIAALAKRSEIFYPLLSGDTEATMAAARALGAGITVRRDEPAPKLLIDGVDGRPATPDDVLNAGNSGTTLRFFTAVAALCEGVTVLTGDDSLRKRPNGALLAALTDLGAEAISTKADGTAPLVVRGPLKGGTTTFNGSQSSQFVSGLLIACPLAGHDSYILATNLSSVPYMRMTTEVIQQAGVEIPCSCPEGSRDYAFPVTGGQAYSLARYTVPGDFSSASYLLAAAAISNSPVRVRNLFPSAQGDSRIVALLEAMGAALHWDRSAGVVEVNGTVTGGLQAISVDLRENPDLVPTIAVVAAVAAGTTDISGVAHLRLKETDRLRYLAEELTKLGVRITEKEDGLRIEGTKGTPLQAAAVSAHDDHRLAMALVVAALTARGESVVSGVDSVKISYPSFFKDMLTLGADIALS